VAQAMEAYDDKERDLGDDVMRQLERMVLLSIIDNKWREHLYEMDYLQEGIHLRAYGQRDPLTEYQREAFSMFEELTEGIKDEFVKYIYRVELVRQDEPASPRPQRVVQNRTEAGEVNTGQPQQAKSEKIGRNAPCWCGSGRKFKKCHGATA
jgi:preprotein translocase subunit SecA